MKWFEIPESLVPKLRELQARDQQVKELVDEDVVEMFPGLGDPMYLTFDGRIIILDMMGELPPREAATLLEATSPIVIAARNRKCPELLDLLPKRGEGDLACSLCSTTGWFRPNLEIEIVCYECGGLGWKAIETELA